MKIYSGRGLLSVTVVQYLITGSLPLIILYLTKSIPLTSILFMLMLGFNVISSVYLSKDIQAIVNKTQNILNGKMIIDEKGINSISEIKTLSDNFNMMARLLGDIMEELQQRSNELENQNMYLEKTATIDQLTQVHNRHYLNSVIPNIHLLLIKGRLKTLSAVFLDIDHFKNFNTKYGHDGGDKTLHHVAQTLASTIRQGDIIVRYGGEEFVILLPNANLLQAKNSAERFRKKIEESSLEINNEKTSVTISLGVAEYQPGENIDDFIFIRTNKTLHRAKNNGRNRVETDETPSVQ